MKTDKEAFDKLLLQLEPNLPDAKARYERLRFRLIKFFDWKQREDSEGLADETIVRTLGQLISGKEILADNPYAYIYGVAKNVYREYVRRQIKRETLLKDFPQQLDSRPDLEDCRSECLQKLLPEKLKLLQQYYLNPSGREALARELDITVNALRLQVHRLKNELRSCHESCRKKLLLT